MKPNFQRLKQPTPADLTESCLGILRSKFYNESGDEKAFHQDREKLLHWVVLYPAAWLNKRGVTIHGDQYRKIFVNVFLQAAAHMASKAKYRPAYLRHVIQEHLKHHGEEYYDAAKATRNLVEQTIVALGRPAQSAPDPVREMAAARQILATGQRRKSAQKRPVNAQLTLLP